MTEQRCQQGQQGRSSQQQENQGLSGQKQNVTNPGTQPGMSQKRSMATILKEHEDKLNGNYQDWRTEVAIPAGEEYAGQFQSHQTL
jgi:hypothetical protein